MEESKFVLLIGESPAEFELKQDKLGLSGSYTFPSMRVVPRSALAQFTGSGALRAHHPEWTEPNPCVGGCYCGACTRS